MDRGSSSDVRSKTYVCIGRMILYSSWLCLFLMSEFVEQQMVACCLFIREELLDRLSSACHQMNWNDLDLCAELRERIECLDAIVDKMVDESKKSDDIDTFIACAVCSQYCWLITAVKTNHCVVDVHFLILWHSTMFTLHATLHYLITGTWLISVHCIRKYYNDLQ